MSTKPLAIAASVCLLGAALLASLLAWGCASAPEVQVVAAHCDVEHTDEVAATVRCEVDLWVDDERASALIETSLEDEIADRCVVGELRYGDWVLGGLFVHPVSAESCEETRAPFGFGAADRPVPSTGKRSAE